MLLLSPVTLQRRIFCLPLLEDPLDSLSSRFADRRAPELLACASLLNSDAPHSACLSPDALVDWLPRGFLAVTSDCTMLMKSGWEQTGQNGCFFRERITSVQCCQHLLQTWWQQPRVSACPLSYPSRHIGHSGPSLAPSKRMALSVDSKVLAIFRLFCSATRIMW